MRSILLKWAALGGCCLGLWWFFAIFTPWIVSLSPTWQRYDAVQEQYGIVSGAVYYSDVPVTIAAEEHTRQAVQEGMRERGQLQPDMRTTGK